MSSVSRLSWQVGLDIPGFEGMVLTNKAIRSEIVGAAHDLYDAVCEGFALDVPTAMGLRDRVEGIHLTYREGPEYDPNNVMQLGTVALENVVCLPGVTNVASSEQPKRRVIITGDSLREEATNLQAAAQEYGLQTACDEYATNNEVETLAFADDKDTILKVAIRMAAARRLLRYCILPRDAFTSEELKSIGFDRWSRELAKTMSVPAGRMKKMRPSMLVKYQDHDYAAKNLWRTM